MTGTAVLCLASGRKAPTVPALAARVGAGSECCKERCEFCSPLHAFRNRILLNHLNTNQKPPGKETPRARHLAAVFKACNRARVKQIERATGGAQQIIILNATLPLSNAPTRWTT